MIVSLSKKLTSYFITHLEVSEEEREVYDYFFATILANALNLTVAFIMGAISGRLLETVIFIACFIAMRALCGGYHADSYSKCLLTFVFDLGLMLVLLHFLNIQWQVRVSIGSLLFSLILVWVLAPVASPNKPLIEEKQQRLKKKSRIWVMALSLLTVLTCFFSSVENLAFPIAYGLFSVACSMAVEKIKTLV